MSHDVKVSATRGDGTTITDRLTPRGMGALAYWAWPGSLFAELAVGDDLTDLIEDYETHTVPMKTFQRVRVTVMKPTGDGGCFVDFEEV